MLTRLVCTTMRLPEETNVHWLLEGERRPWIVKYTTEGTWHTDIFQNTSLEERTWSLCVVLHSSKSMFLIENNINQVKSKSSVIIFQSHMRHRGMVEKGGSRIVLAAEFKLDFEAQTLVLQRN